MDTKMEPKLDCNATMQLLQRSKLYYEVTSWNFMQCQKNHL